MKCKGYYMKNGYRICKHLDFSLQNPRFRIIKEVHKMTAPKPLNLRKMAAQNRDILPFSK